MNPVRRLNTTHGATHCQYRSNALRSFAAAGSAPAQPTPPASAEQLLAHGRPYFQTTRLQRPCFAAQRTSDHFGKSGSIVGGFSGQDLQSIQRSELHEAIW